MVAAIYLAFVLALALRAQDTAATMPLTVADLQSLPSLSSAQLSALMNKLQAVPIISADAVPMGSSYYSLKAPTFPPLPCNLSGCPVWNLGSGQYLVNDLNYIAPAQPMALGAGAGMRAMDASGPPGFGVGGDGANDSGYVTNYYTPFVIPTNGALWLQISNTDLVNAYLTLNNSTDSVYEILTKWDLNATNWNIEEEVWPTNATMSFVIPQLGRTNLFVWAQDWTGVTEGTNIVPDWWYWQNFGSAIFPYGNGSLTLSDTNLDSYGNTLLSDYQNGTDPNILQFSIEVTNNYVNNLSAPVQLNVFAGVPSYYAVSVDDTNYIADASWQPYTGTNLSVNLGSTQGWHVVWIGLRGNADATNQAAWQYKRLKLNATPPVLVITNPTVSTLSVPLVQINGYSPQALANVTYDLSNAVGVVTGQSGWITGKYYDTNTWDFTTNYFAAVDVPLAPGLNVISLHATDLAGNNTTTNLNLTLDYSSRTNPPAFQLFWPQNGEQISGSNFTWRGWVDDPSATVSAQMIGADGTTNSLSGLVERNGNFWVENLPMPTGTNSLTLTVTDSAGNIATTNISVSTSPLTVTMTPIPNSQLWYKIVTATGSISDSTYSLWINGVKAGVTNGVWTATQVPMTPGGVASFKVTCYAPGETQPDGSTGN